MWLWETNEAQQEQHMEANRSYEDAMQLPIANIQDFDQSLSLGDAIILHALGVKVTLHPEMATL